MRSRRTREAALLLLAAVPPVLEAAVLVGVGLRAAHERLIGFLAGDRIDQPRREYRLYQRLGAAWQPPPLALSVNPTWSATREADPAFTGRICEAR